MTASSKYKYGINLAIMFLLPLLIISNLSFFFTDKYLTDINGLEQEVPQEINIKILDLEINQDNIADLELLITELINNLETDSEITIIDSLDATNTWNIKLADIAFEYDIAATIDSIMQLNLEHRKQEVPLIVNFDSLALKQELQVIAEQFDSHPVDAYLRSDESGNKFIVNEVFGKKLDVDKMFNAISALLSSGSPKIELLTIYIELEPGIKSIDLEQSSSDKNDNESDNNKQNDDKYDITK